MLSKKKVYTSSEMAGKYCQLKGPHIPNSMAMMSLVLMGSNVCDCLPESLPFHGYLLLAVWLTWQSLNAKYLEAREYISQWPNSYHTP